MYMDLKSFIKKQFPFSLPPIKLSQLSRTFIERIIYQIHLGQKVSKKHIHDEILKPNTFPKTVDFNYIVDEIREQIENLPKIGKRYSFIIGDRPFNIYAILPYSSRISSKSKIYDMLDAAIKKMYIWLYAASYFASNDCSRELTVYWYLTEHKKELPKNDVIYKVKSIEPIDQIHANTAFTLACPEASNFIYIFRKEEWFKVFIHESFHSLGLDFAKMPENHTNHELFSMFSISCDVRFYEAYTEMWAEIICTLFDCLTEKSLTTIFKKMEDQLNNERMFSIFQKAKVLNHHKIQYRELVGGLKGITKYKESTPAFSYYVLKCILMFSCNDFIEWCAMKNKGTIAFKKTQVNILSLVDFIRNRYNDPIYMDAIRKFELWFSKTDYVGPEMDTMRMTVYA